VALSKEERRARIRERALDLLGPVLKPGEQVTNIVPAQTRPRATYGLEFVIGLAMLSMIRWYVVATTDRRLFVLDCGRSGVASDVWKPKTIDWDEPLDAVRLIRYTEGLLYTKLYLEVRHEPRQTIRLHAPRTMRVESRELARTLGGASGVF
jgi:hypothetical protein